MPYYILKSYKLKLEPFEIFLALSRQGQDCFFLDSSINYDYSLGRYSFLGITPFYILKTKEQNPFKQLREFLDRYKIALPRGELPFFGGAVGYLAYDLGFILENKLKKKPKEELSIPDCYFGFYNTVVIIDHLKNLLYLLALGFPERNSRLAKLLCESNFKKIYKLLSEVKIGRSQYNKYKYKQQGGELKSNFSKEDYLRSIKTAKEYIKNGDIYQVNLSQRFQAETELSALELYQRLRRLSPSYFSAYLDAGDFQILSSSPERFLELRKNLVTTRPMKGTRPRSENKLDDQRFREDLIKSAKDKAELIMIVDLERNDLGKVCSYDSVKVATLRQLEEYATVFQATSTISGRLYLDKDRIDLLRACFPGGSITGCPKIRAMEIIEELEPTRRSIYTGALGYLSFSGSMDFNILIRTILKKDKRIYFGVGGGIVADSKPEDEYQETLVKARGMMEAINSGTVLK